MPSYLVVLDLLGLFDIERVVEGILVITGLVGLGAQILQEHSLMKQLSILHGYGRSNSQHWGQSISLTLWQVFFISIVLLRGDAICMAVRTNQRTLTTRV